MKNHTGGGEKMKNDGLRLLNPEKKFKYLGLICFLMWRVYLFCAFSLSNAEVNLNTCFLCLCFGMGSLRSTKPTILLCLNQRECWRRPFFPIQLLYSNILQSTNVYGSLFNIIIHEKRSYALSPLHLGEPKTLQIINILG